MFSLSARQASPPHALRSLGLPLLSDAEQYHP